MGKVRKRNDSLRLSISLAFSAPFLPHVQVYISRSDAKVIRKREQITIARPATSDAWELTRWFSENEHCDGSAGLDLDRFKMLVVIEDEALEIGDTIPEKVVACVKER